jgi:hypothetical protein
LRFPLFSGCSKCFIGAVSRKNFLGEKRWLAGRIELSELRRNKTPKSSMQTPGVFETENSMDVTTNPLKQSCLSVLKDLYISNLFPATPKRISSFGTFNLHPTTKRFNDAKTFGETEHE